MPLRRTTSRQLPHVTTPAKKLVTLATVGPLQQRLCDETRAQYEALLERQETAHERQLLAAHRQLQDVLRSHIALVDHEKLVVAEYERHRRELAEHTARHVCELALQEATWRRKWQQHETELVARCEQETNRARERLPALELERNDALRRLKEQEIEELTWSDVLCEAHRAQELAETRLDEACKHLVTLRMRVKRLEQRADTVNDEKRAKMTFYTKWQQTTLLLAETKGDVGKQLAGLKQELTHAHTTLADERERHTTCQTEVLALRALTHSLETASAELRAATQAATERHAAERAQFEKELLALQSALATRRTKLLRTREQLAAEAKRVQACDMRVQTLETALVTTEQRGNAREASWRRQRHQLRAHVTELEALVRELQARRQDEQHDEELSRLLFGSE